jgi:subtilisin family serine protease
VTAAPDVLINAWALPAPGCDRSLERIVDAWRVAGILPVFAAGNRGPAPSSDASPGNYGLSVGGVTRAGTIVPSSSRGPNSCDGSVFPTLVAPAEAVPAAFPLTPSAYIEGRGTSIAAGFVAGAAALLVQRYPTASVPELERALRRGARHPAPGGADNTYGYGVLDVGAALDSLGSFLATQDTARRTRTPPTHR